MSQGQLEEASSKDEEAYYNGNAWRSLSVILCELVCCRWRTLFWIQKMRLSA